MLCLRCLFFRCFINLSVIIASVKKHFNCVYKQTEKMAKRLFKTPGIFNCSRGSVFQIVRVQVRCQDLFISLSIVFHRAQRSWWEFQLIGTNGGLLEGDEIQPFCCKDEKISIDIF